MNHLSPLQTAFIRQSRDVKDNAWVVFSEDGVELYDLPNNLTPKEAMAHLHFARKFELEALEAGINQGRHQSRTAATNVINELRAKVALLEQQNIGLSTQLEKFIIEGAI